MPLFFFDFVEGPRTSEDNVGTEFRDLQVARAEALMTLAEIARHRVPKGDGQISSIQIRSEDGSKLLTATLTLRVERHGRASIPL